MGSTSFPPVRRFWRACVLGAGLLHAAHAAQPPAGVVLAPVQEMVRNNRNEPESLDPHQVEGSQTANILADLFEALTAVDNHGKTVPGIARSWRRTDPTTWVFELRPDLRWSDGTPLDANDVVYAWRRLFDPKTAAPLASFLGGYLLNGMAVVEGRMPPAALGVRAVDANTLELKTPSPMPFLPDLLAYPQLAPVPRAAIEKYGRDWTRPGRMVSNGAYVLKDWQVNSKVVVVKNPRYWDAAAVALTQVTYLPVEDSQADLKLYQSGADDYMHAVPPGAYPALKAQYPKEMHNGPQIAFSNLTLNNTDPLLKDARVRQALSMVLDRELLASRVMAAGELPLYGLTLQGSVGVDPVRPAWADWPMARRVAEARQLLAQTAVKPGTRLRLLYGISDSAKKLMLFVSAEWKAKLGLETALEAVEFKVKMRRLATGDYQIGGEGLSPGFTDISGLLPLVMCGHEQNHDRSCNPAADALIRQADTQTDPARRKDTLTAAVRLAMDGHPYIPLLQSSTPRLVKPWIGGYDDANDLDSFRSKDFYVLKH